MKVRIDTQAAAATFGEMPVAASAMDGRPMLKWRHPAH